MRKGAALLQCDSVVRNTITGNVNALKEWGAANAKYLFENEPDTREYGFVVVTSTFRTPKCSLRCWPKTDHEYSPTSDATVLRNNVSGHISAQWGQSGWIRVPVKDDSVTSGRFDSDLRLPRSLWFSLKGICFGVTDLAFLPLIAQMM
jgi:hypothetical protein